MSGESEEGRRPQKIPGRQSWTKYDDVSSLASVAGKVLWCNSIWHDGITREKTFDWHDVSSKSSGRQALETGHVSGAGMQRRRHLVGREIPIALFIAC